MSFNAPLSGEKDTARMKAELFEGLLARCTVRKRHEMRYVSEVFISQPLFFWAVCSCAMTPIPGWSSLLSDCGRMHERKWSSVRLFRLTASSVTKRGRLWADFRLPHFLIAWPTYECDAVISPRDSLQRARVWQSMTKPLSFSPSTSLLQTKEPASYRGAVFTKEQK